MTTLVIPERVLSRVWTRIIRGHPSHCWRSTWRHAPDGRPHIGWWADGRSHGTTASRVVWTSVRGPIPAAMTVDHRCRRPWCLNPRCFRLLENLENAIDNWQAQRGNPLWVPGRLETCQRSA